MPGAIINGIAMAMLVVMAVLVVCLGINLVVWTAEDVFGFSVAERIRDMAKLAVNKIRKRKPKGEHSKWTRQ